MWEWIPVIFASFLCVLVSVNVYVWPESGMIFEFGFIAAF
jgi:hypothetical protein